MVVTKADAGPQNKTCFNAAANPKTGTWASARDTFRKKRCPFALADKEGTEQQTKEMEIKISITHINNKNKNRNNLEQGARLRNGSYMEPLIGQGSR